MLADTTPGAAAFPDNQRPRAGRRDRGHRPPPPRQPGPSPRPRTPSVPACAALHGSRAGRRAKTELALADAYRAPSQSRVHRGVQGRSSTAAHRQPPRRYVTLCGPPQSQLAGQYPPYWRSGGKSESAEMLSEPHPNGRSVSPVCANTHCW